MYKFKILFIILILPGVIFLSCNFSNDKENNQPEKITLKKWLSEKETLENINNPSTCDSLQEILGELKIEEFRIPVYLDLAQCYIDKGNKAKAENYLLKYLSFGKHLSWIDSTRFAVIFPRIKREYPKLQEEFWKEKDTSYFLDIEKRVSLDQSLGNGSEKDQKERKEVFIVNSKYLLEFSEANGFPWQPGPNNFKKKQFRIRIAPDVIAVHAPIKEKIKLRKYAIESAENGKNSWLQPIFIGVTFYTQLSREVVKPIRFIYFDKNNQLEMEKSYLQLYCIKKYMNDNGIPRIKIQPSKTNSLDQRTLKTQLKETKNILIKEFSYNPSSIEVSLSPDVLEKDRQEMGVYNYTFTTY